MFKAGMKKESLLFTRSFRLWGVLIALLLFAFTDPLMVKGIQYFTKDLNLDALGTVETSLSLYTNATASSAVTMAITDMRGMGILICMLVMMGTAGGELKKRATIIPNCSGLTPAAYLAPKFVFFPIFIFIATIIASFASVGVSLILFGGPIDLGAIALGAVLSALYMAFLIVLYLAIGLSTARSGIAVAVCYCLSTILQIVLSAFNINKYQPFALVNQSINVMNGNEVEIADILLSTAATIAIGALCYLVTLFVHNAKRVNNIGEEKVAL